MKFEVPVAMCPQCKVELDCRNFFLEECDGSSAWFSAEGRCPNCYRDFKWEEKYVFSGCTEPECID